MKDSLQNDIFKETKGMLNSSCLTGKGKVFERRNRKKGNEEPILKPGQESEPRDKPTHHPIRDKSSPDPTIHCEFV